MPVECPSDRVTVRQSGPALSAAQLLHLTRALGYAIWTDGTRVWLYGEAIPDGLLAAIRQAKPALVALLAADRAAPGCGGA